MAEYRAKTAPILPIYEARGIVTRVDGMARYRRMSRAAIEAILDAQGLSAAAAPDRAAIQRHPPLLRSGRTLMQLRICSPLVAAASADGGARRAEVVRRARGLHARATSRAIAAPPARVWATLVAPARWWSADAHAIRATPPISCSIRRRGAAGARRSRAAAGRAYAVVLIQRRAAAAPLGRRSGRSRRAR